MEPENKKETKAIWKYLLVAVTLIVLVTWLKFTPGGLMGKADAIGYAVCHQIELHSFHFGTRQLSLCARCTGMHLGILLGLAYHFKFGKRGSLPEKKFLIIMGLFLVAFGIDGSNSYINLPGETNGQIGLPIQLPVLYTPQNWIRLLTGTMLGISISALIYPLFNQTIWADWENKPALSSWKDFGILVGLGLLVDLAVLSNNILLLYPLAILSAFDVLIILGILYSIIWTMLLKRENSYREWKEVWVLLLLGFVTALTQIALMDLGRYILTGSWDGFMEMHIKK